MMACRAFLADFLGAVCCFVLALALCVNAWIIAEMLR